MTIAFTLVVPFERLEETLDTANLGSDTAAEDGADAGDGGQLGEDWVGLQFGGDPVVDTVELSFEEADAVEGEIKDTLVRKSERRVEDKALVSHTLEFAGIVKRLWKGVATEFAELTGQGLDPELSQLVRG